MNEHYLLYLVHLLFGCRLQSHIYNANNIRSEGRHPRRGIYQAAINKESTER